LTYFLVVIYDLLFFKTWESTKVKNSRIKSVNLKPRFGKISKWYNIFFQIHPLFYFIILIIIKYILINFNESNNIYNTNHNIFNINIINYYKNNIIYNYKNNNIFDINTINYTKKYIKKKYNINFNINYTRKIILREQIIIVLRSTLLIRLKKNIFNTNTINYTEKNIY
jgi:hypothetical protein